jgi:hypothetical protein
VAVKTDDLMEMTWDELCDLADLTGVGYAGLSSEKALRDKLLQEAITNH